MSNAEYNYCLLANKIESEYDKMNSNHRLFEKIIISSIHSEIAQHRGIMLLIQKDIIKISLQMEYDAWRLVVNMLGQGYSAPISKKATQSEIQEVLRNAINYILYKEEE